RASLLKAVELRAAQADTRKSRDLASGLVSVLASKKVFTHPADDLVRVKAAVEKLTQEACHRAFVESWDSRDIQIFLGGKLKLEGDAAAQIIAAYQDSAGRAVAPPAKEEIGSFAYTDFGAPGKVTRQELVKDLEITQATFANNIRVNIKPTPFEKGTVRVTLNFGGGKLTAPKDRPGLIPFAQSTFILGGLKAHSADDLRRLFASKTVGMDFNVADEAFTLSGRTTPADLEAQLQLLTAFLTAPGYREEAERQFRQNLEPMYIQLAHTAEGIMNDKVVAHLHGGDFRFGFPEKTVLEQRSLAELAAWLEKPLASDYLEVSIVGDVDTQAALDAVAKTLGALPARAAEKPAYTAERQISFPAPGSTEMKFQTEIPKAVAALYWPTGDMLDIQRTRRLTLLGSILDDRLRVKVREELGETYSPACYHVANDTFTGYGYMTAMIECKAEQAAPISDLVLQIADELATGEISDDEFDRAKKPILSQLEQMRRDNRYWAQNVVRNCQEHPERLDWSRSLIPDFTGITKADVAALARQFLPKTRAIGVKVLPEAAK
ncbi:MAG: insulinase family protein, partial [Prosthecobacter sp.]|nr:insulinase family protein [Prosthecobacter sp.]